jgi:hypothetical protein
MNGKNGNSRGNPNQIPPNSKHPTFSNFSIQDLFKGKHLDIVAAALLLSGRLKVDSVELFRGSPTVTVTLLGKYLTQEKVKANALADFLEENGDMTLDDVFEALQKRLEKGDNK